LPSTPQRLAPDARFESVVGLGDFWCHVEQVEGLVALKQRSGARLVHLIHDLVALVNPQWTHPHYGRQFVDQLRRLTPHVDHWLATSGHVAGQVTQHLQQAGAPPRPVDTIPMGWPRIAAGPADLAADLGVLDRHGLKPEEYLLHVGTVEPRKNLTGLFDAMALVARELGERAPRCVLVGRNGWRSKDVRHRLRNDDRLSSRIMWLQEAPDSELRALYRFARFTVVPSFDEGWGLAVQESLAHGTPCVAAAVGGIPESGRGLVCYAASCAPADLARVMSHLLTDRKALSAARDAIAKDVTQSDALPTWQMAADAVLDAARGQKA
jgi:glycosyltransferase involved in cell wall biosynthesis